MTDYTWPSVYFAYLFFFLSAALCVYFFIRSWKDGYWGKDAEEIKYVVFGRTDDRFLSSVALNASVVLRGITDQACAHPTHPTRFSETLTFGWLVSPDTGAALCCCLPPLAQPSTPFRAWWFHHPHCHPRKISTTALNGGLSTPEKRT